MVQTSTANVQAIALPTREIGGQSLGRCRHLLVAAAPLACGDFFRSQFSASSRKNTTGNGDPGFPQSLISFVWLGIGQEKEKALTISLVRT